MYRIEFARQEHVELIASWLSEEELRATFPVEGEREVNDFARVLVEYGQKEATLVLYAQEVPIGVATLYLSHYIKIKHHASLQLLVQKEHRKKGAGSYLLEQIVQVAKDKGLEHIELELYENPYAAWFEKRQFQPYARQKKFLKVEDKHRDRILYRRVL